MKKIPKPIFTVRNVVIDCIDNYREPLKQAFLDALDIFDNAEDDFESKKQLNQLYLLKQKNIDNGIINKEALIKIYTDKMVSQTNNPKGRVYYDRIFLSAPQGICPLCLQREVKTLDHYLPKTKYPLLSVTPINLIPSCSDCNKGKLSDSPAYSHEETLHPYYDDVECFSWLKMRITQINPLILEFYIAPPESIPKLLSQRIKYHFENFSLNKLYISHAMQEFANNKLHFTRLYERGGNKLLKEHVFDCFESRREININSWQTAFYECLFQDENFCKGLFIE